MNSSFLERLKTKVKPIKSFDFPSDSDVSKNLRVKLEKIESKKKSITTTNREEPVFLYREKPRTLGKETLIIYYIINVEGEQIGKIFARINPEDPSTAELEYFVSPTNQKQGVATCAVNTLIVSIFENQELNGTIDNNKIKDIKLYITDDNEASIRLANKLGFKKKENVHQLCKEDYENEKDNGR